MHIKQTPEEFLVEEIPSRTWLELSGRFNVYRVVKRDMTTPELIKQLSRLNGVQPRDLRYAGLKDKHATTIQYLTSQKKLTRTPDDVIMEHVGYTEEHLHLGDLDANRFKITVRDVKETRDVEIPNYFGDQRFSTNNVEVGLAILKGDFFGAAQALAKDFPEAAFRLDQDPSQPVQALAAVPNKILLLYVHSVQSWLFNEAVSAWIKDNCDEFVEAEYRHGILRFPTQLEDMQVPVPGAAQDLGDWEKYYIPLMEKAEISPATFRVNALPHLTQEGEMRSLRSDIRDKQITQKSSNMYELILELGSGCYATVCVAGWFA